MADQDDVIAFANEAVRFEVDLGHQRAGRVDDLQRTLLGLLEHARRDAVRAENRVRPFGHVVQLVHEYDAAGLEPLHDVAVVYDFLADVDGRAVDLQRQIHDSYGAIHTRTKPPRIRQHESHRTPISCGTPPLYRS